MKRNFRVSPSSISSSIKTFFLIIISLVVVLFLLFLRSVGDGEVDENVSHLKSSDPIIYVITPTYKHLHQKALLTQMSQVFSIVPNVFWIVVEDAEQNSSMVDRVIHSANLQYRSHHFAEPDKNQTPRKGLVQRNAGLRWLRNFIHDKTEHSLVYFADEDFIYSVNLFVEITKIEKWMVGVWPVAFVGGMIVESPLVHEGTVVDFNSRRARIPHRHYPIDIVGFAISSLLILEHPDVEFEPQKVVGYEESYFLEGLIASYDSLQPLAFDCTEILVWHMKPAEPDLSLEGLHPSNDVFEV